MKTKALISCEADLCLCFGIGKNLVFSRCGSYDMHFYMYAKSRNYFDYFAKI